MEPIRQGMPQRFIPARAGNTWGGRSRANVRTVHPRSRGEHDPDKDRTIPAYGSSPLARGTPTSTSRSSARFRFIPARAGNTVRRNACPVMTPVHPRSRGEHDARAAGGEEAAGSSPLARGTHVADQGYGLRVRFIPARAGNTRRTILSDPICTVHPRSRGEHVLPAMVRALEDGSSPLARGTRCIQSGCPPGGRFIPARAGNTRIAVTVPVELTGSSPLARGTRAVGAHRAGGHRFIPARAGNTPTSALCQVSPTVHPRSRGEHFRRTTASQSPTGSSPLARGTRPAASAEQVEYRFIPARAGNTSPRAPHTPRSAVHPRSRGEHSIRSPAPAPPAGSSPLARGTRRERGAIRIA